VAKFKPDVDAADAFIKTLISQRDEIENGIKLRALKDDLAAAEKRADAVDGGIKDLQGRGKLLVATKTAVEKAIEKLDTQMQKISPTKAAVSASPPVDKAAAASAADASPEEAAAADAAQ
jgi:predicted  nucleic acid-binding Zn-ribbon protein